MRLRRTLLALLLALPSLAAAQYRTGRVVVPNGATPGPVLILGPQGYNVGPTLTPNLHATLKTAFDERAVLSPQLSGLRPAPGLMLASYAGVAAADGPSASLVAAPAVAAAPLAPAQPAAAEAPRVPGEGSASLPNGVDAAPRTAPTLRDWLRRYGTADPTETAARLARAFDGTGRVRSDDGHHFEAQPDPRSAAGVRLVRVGLAPAQPAPAKEVPGTAGLSGSELLNAVSRAARQGQRQHEYGEASDFLFSQADNVTINGVRGVVDAYSGVFIAGSSPDGRDYPEPGDRNHDGHVDEGMNVEHVWPQSRFNKALPMRSDLHHLMATFIHPNGVRAALPFGVVRGRPTYQNDAGTRSDGEVFEPADFTKGRVARAMLYFYARYKDGNIQRGGAQWFDRQIDVLLDWNRRFPPDAGERRRNDLVEGFQGNRNPFVDDPGLADRIGREAFRPNPPQRKARRQEAKGFKRPGRFSGARRR